MTTATRSATILVVETSAYRIERTRGAQNFDAFVTGRGYIGSRPTQSEALALINQYFYDAPAELAQADDNTPADAPGSDCPSHGPYGDDDCPKCSAIATAQHLANVIQAPTYVVERDGRCYVQDTEDLGAYWYSHGGLRAGSRIIASCMPARPAPAPLPVCIACNDSLFPESPRIPHTCIACANAQYAGFTNRFAAARVAQSMRSLGISATLLRNRICKNCQGAHYGWQCPEIRAELFSDDAAACVYDNDEMVRLWASSRALLVIKLRRLTRPQLTAQAVAFAAWLNERTHTNLSAASVLHIWETMIAEYGDGPAAPALRMAA